ncbi:MAG: hypothetical protein IPM29_13800 [Planctomycetes bacterium]|nr:hypothetical protein [Planctomycetota bacterium]
MSTLAPRTFGVLALAAFGAGCALAQSDLDRARGLVARQVTIETGPLAGRTFAYRLLLPATIGPDERLPVVLFLHGAGERGDDNVEQVRHFPERMAREAYRERYRTIVIAPQCPRGERWVDVAWNATDGEHTGDARYLDVARAALARTLAEEPCDPDRVYLTGLSMGGFGAWSLACAEPERFAALLPICGGGDPARAERLADLPLWTWHGAADPVVPVDYTRRMVAAVRAAGGAPLYTELPAEGHGAWNAAYAIEAGALDWLFARRREVRDLGLAVACDTEAPRLLLLDTLVAADGPGAQRWEWSPRDADGLREEQVAWFDDPCDVKCIDAGRSLLAAAGGGAVFVVRVADRSLELVTRVDGTPAAVERLPDGRLAVASDGRVLLLAPVAGKRSPPLATVTLDGAAALCWDPARGELCALGARELVGLVPGAAAWTERWRTALPATGQGRDLCWLPGPQRVLVATTAGVLELDADAHRLAPATTLADAGDLLSLAELRAGGPWLCLPAVAPTAPQLVPTAPPLDWPAVRWSRLRAFR